MDDLTFPAVLLFDVPVIKGRKSYSLKKDIRLFIIGTSC